MKKFVLLSIMAVAAIMTFSCAKQGLDTTTKGKMVTLTVTAPDLDEEPGSKVSFNGALHTAFVWDGNESLHLFSYTKATEGNPYGFPFLRKKVETHVFLVYNATNYKYVYS